jgi:hypothetical protein
MTPLQTAAQQALEALESGKLLCEVTAASMLRVALEAEQAQAVEPVLFIDASTLAMNAAHVGAWKPGHELEGNLPLYLHPPAQAQQAQAVEPIGYIRHADKTFWPHPECAVYASVSPSLAPVYAHPAPPVEQAQSQPVSTVQCVRGVTIGYLDVMQPVGTKLYTHPAQQVAAPVPDMFWNHDDADKLYSSISEFLNDEMCSGTELAIGDIRTVQRAVRLPNIDIRITSVNDDECDADYEIVEAQGAKP